MLFWSDLNVDMMNNIKDSHKQFLRYFMWWTVALGIPSFFCTTFLVYLMFGGALIICWFPLVILVDGTSQKTKLKYMAFFLSLTCVGVIDYFLKR